MPFVSLPYKQIHEMQQLVADQAKDTDGKTLASLIVAWCRAEQMKREMRGLPPLKAVSMRELADMKLARMRRAKRNAPNSPAILDVPATVSPMSTAVDKITDQVTPTPEPKTVTAPPPPDVP